MYKKKGFRLKKDRDRIGKLSLNLGIEDGFYERV